MFNIQRLDIKSIDEQVRVFIDSFDSNTSFELEKKRWEEKHYNNPLGHSIIYGAFNDNNELVGINAFLKLKYNINGTLFEVLQSCESGVRKDSRRQGIWKRIVDYALEDLSKNQQYSLIIGFPNFDNSYPGFVKMGWKTLKNMKNLILIGNTSNFSKAYFNGKKVFFHKLFSLFGMKSIKRFLKNPDCLTISEYDFKGNDIFVNQKDGICVSNSFLFWKKTYAKWIVKAIYQQDELIGLLVYEVENKHSVECIKLVGLRLFSSCSIKMYEKILCFSVGYILVNNPNAAYIRTWAKSDNSDYKVFKKDHFLLAKHNNPFILKSLKDGQTAALFEKECVLSFFDLD